MKRWCCLRPVNSFAMAAQDVLGSDLPERARRKQAQKRMDREVLARPEEVRSRAESVCDDEQLVLGPPDRGLPPHGQVHRADDLEG